MAFSATEEATLAGAFASAGADEGTLWLLDEAQTALIPVWNSGPRAEQFVGRHRQPLDAGLISLVCVTGQALCENAVYQNAAQDPTLDRSLGLLTCAMIAVPLHFRAAMRGVVSCVKLKPARDAGPDPAPFSGADLAAITAAVEALGQTLDAP